MRTYKPASFDLGAVNPRKFNLRTSGMLHWQMRGGAYNRDALVPLPAEVMQSVYRRLRRWTFYRDLADGRYYLLYRGLRPDEMRAIESKSPGDTIEMDQRTSYTVEPAIAVQFAMSYGTDAIGEWVPESAIITAPFGYGPALSSYNHAELEMIVDPHRGILQDTGINHRDRTMFKGWVGDANHPWQIEWERKLGEMRDGRKGVKLPTNPNGYRINPPTPDSKTSRGF
jgi:hypothetical protein